MKQISKTKKQMKIVPAILIPNIVILTAWCVNLYKLTQCDFEPSWKGEIIHGIGLIPPAALVTVWFSDK